MVKHNSCQAFLCNLGTFGKKSGASTKLFNTLFDIIINENAYAFYYRFRIKNSDNIFTEKAEKVEIFATELLDHRQEKIESFLPRRFIWTHTSDTTYDNISPGMEKNCELLRYIDPKYTDNKNTIDLLLEAGNVSLPIDS